MIEIKKGLEEILISPTLTSEKNRIFLGENSKLCLYFIEDIPNISLEIEQERDSTLELFFINEGNEVNIDINLNGENCTSNISGVYNLFDNSKASINTNIRHNFPHCESMQNFRGIAHDKSNANINMMTYVAPGAIKTNGNQLHRALLLSENAKVFAKPELEIYNDDVKCSHGNTIGNLDKDILFYLQSRGIPFPKARRMLIDGFLNEAASSISSSKVKDMIYKKIDYIS